MINVNKITSTLAKLPDQQLQQYAQMHKSDPYIMALAMSESNRRKEMRAAGQGAQGMQEQPKVVDQEIARMGDMQNASPEQMARLSQLLEARKQAEYKEFTGGGREQPIPQQQQQLPEDQGIGQLPAGNMDFASGGIIAFADGGGVEHYYGGGSTAATMYDPMTGVPISAENTSGNDLTFLESIGVFNPENRRALEKADRAAAKKQTAIPYNQATMPAAGYTRTDPRAAGAGTFADSVKAVSAAPTVDPTRRAGPSAGPAAPIAAAVPSTGPTDIDALQQKYFGGIDQEVGGLRNARAGLVAGIKDLTEKNLAATEADIAARGDVFKGREERLAAREKGVEGMGDKYMGLALLQAGAAMMSTPGALGAALGKGIQVGSERYVAGLDKINAAKDRFADARDRLDDLRINRDDMNARDIRAAKKEAREAELKGQELLYNGLVSDLGIKQKNVSEIFRAASEDLKTTRQIDAERANTITREGGANARSAAQIAATLSAPDKVMFAQALKKHNNDAFKAWTDVQQAQGDKFNLRTSYADYLKAFAGKDGLTPPMSLGAYAGLVGATLPR